MKIYFSHSRGFDFQKELYQPVRNSQLSQQHEIIFPHEHSDESFNSKELLKTCDLMLAEVSYISTGLGIELGWANALGCPIVCFYRQNSQPSPSVSKVTNQLLMYSSEDEMLKLIAEALN